MPPETRYAKSGDVAIAYQVVGDGEHDIVLVPGYISNVEFYLFQNGSFGRFAANLQRLPHDERSTIIRSVFPNGYGIFACARAM